MKRFGVILLLQFIVISVAAFAGSWAYSRWQSGCPAPASDEVSWFRSQLGLNAEQAAKLEKLHDSFRAAQSKLCEQHCAKRFELGELIQQSDSMSPRIETMAKELSALEAQSQRLTLEHIFEVGKQLDATQRAKFVHKVYEQMCTSCPMGSHKPGTGKQASCESAGCECGVTSSDGDSQPVPPVANAPLPFPRLEFARPTLSQPIRHSDPSVSNEPPLFQWESGPALPRFVLFNAFLI